MRDPSPTIALGRSGDAVAAWWDDANGGRIAFARKRAGGTWSAPVTVAAPVSATPLFPAVDGSGNISVAYTSGGATTIATWAAGAPAPTLAPLPGPALAIGGFAVNAAGDAVLAGLGPGPTTELTVAYRQGPTNAFALRTYPYSGPGGIMFAVQSARATINASGAAVVIFRANTLRAITRTRTGEWPATPEDVAPAVTTVQDASLALGMDDAGNAYAAYTYTVAGPATVLQARLRPAAGGWQSSGDLSPTTAMSMASSVTLQVAPSGTAVLVWLQAVGAVSSVKARYGATSTTLWGATEDVNDAGANGPTAAIGDDGTVVAVWEHQTGGNNVGEARVRTPGAAGVWGDVRPLTAAHPNGTTPSLSGDGRGDFATVSTPYDGTYHPVLLSYYDAAPPVIPAPTVTGALFAGSRLTLATTPTDAFSTAGTPAWTFGDGGAATGASVTHAYAAPGSYTAHVTVTDTAGNTAGADVAIVVANAQATVGSATFSARWKQSRVTGTLVVKGTVPLAGTYVLDVFKGRARKFHFSVKLTGPDFSRTIRLPATFLPGSYRIVLDPSASFARGAEIEAKLAAPPEGVVDVKKLSATRTGKAVRTIRASRGLFASFHFAALPKGGTLKLTWYRTLQGQEDDAEVGHPEAGREGDRLRSRCAAGAAPSAPCSRARARSSRSAPSRPRRTACAALESRFLLPSCARGEHQATEEAHQGSRQAAAREPALQDDDQDLLPPARDGDRRWRHRRDRRRAQAAAGAGRPRRRPSCAAPEHRCAQEVEGRAHGRRRPARGREAEARPQGRRRHGAQDRPQAQRRSSAPVRREVAPGIELDDDRDRIDVATVHGYVSEHAYWAIGRPLATMQHLIDDAARLVGLYDGDRQIGFCRVASDDTTYAWLFDVYVLPEYRGRGLGVELVREAVENGPHAQPALDPAHAGHAPPVRALRLHHPDGALHGAPRRRLIDSNDDVRTRTPSSLSGSHGGTEGADGGSAAPLHGEAFPFL